MIKSIITSVKLLFGVTAQVKLSDVSRAQRASHDSSLNIKERSRDSGANPPGTFVGSGAADHHPGTRTRTRTRSGRDPLDGLRLHRLPFGAEEGW